MTGSSRCETNRSNGVIFHALHAPCTVKYSLIVLFSEAKWCLLPLVLPSPTQTSSHHQSHLVTAADILQKLHDVFTHRLPDKIYFYLSRGINSGLWICKLLELVVVLWYSLNITPHKTRLFSICVVVCTVKSIYCTVLVDPYDIGPHCIIHCCMRLYRHILVNIVITILLQLY